MTAEIIKFNSEDVHKQDIVYEMLDSGYTGTSKAGTVLVIDHRLKKFTFLEEGERLSRAFSRLYETPQFLVRPSDNHIFETTGHDGLYDTYCMGHLSTGIRPFEHFNKSVLMSRYGFFPITEEELDKYQNLFNSSM